MGVNARMKTNNTAQIGTKSKTARTPDCEVAIIGAGPYGLSAAAHLKANGIETRVFGRPMEFWADKMPAGMLLRSPRVASNISDPVGAFTLDAYESAASEPARAPVPLETFVAYGRWFQRQLTPDLDQREVASIETGQRGFQVHIEGGETLNCKRVVVAAGIGPFQRIPDTFAALPPSQISHCYSGCDVRSLSGQRVAVIGAGQSALETAALLHEAGSEVELIARIPVLRWIGMHGWLHHLGPVSSFLYSQHDVGPLGISRLVAYPNLMKRVPLKLRDKIRKRAVRAAGSRWLPPRLKDVKLTTGRFVVEAASAGHEVRLKLDDGSSRLVDKVVLGTGYSVDIARYRFLDSRLVQQVRQYDGYPVLRSGFCSSVPGLHFIGATSARSFGPLMYFVAGTDFSSQELIGHIAANRTVPV